MRMMVNATIEFVAVLESSVVACLVHSFLLVQLTCWEAVGWYDSDWHLHARIEIDSLVLLQHVVIVLAAVIEGMVRMVDYTIPVVPQSVSEQPSSIHH